MHHKDVNKMREEKARWELQKNPTSYSEKNPGSNTHERTAVRPLTTHHKNIQGKQDTQNTTSEARTNS